jgi:hypothetical protein
VNWRDAVAQGIGIWPVYGRALLAYYEWARREIRPTNPDAFYVGRRYAYLVREFGPLFPTDRKAQQ